MGPKVSGPALVARDGFSARYDLDRIAGVFSRPAHKLVGQSYVGRILVLDTAKGGAFGDITMMAGFDEDVTAAVANGAQVEIDPAARTLRML
jgi:predicted aconitase with swiveling domain